MVHRDVKPGNILVDRSGVVKVLDMGLMRWFNTEQNEDLTEESDDVTPANRGLPRLNRPWTAMTSIFAPTFIAWE